MPKGADNEIKQITRVYVGGDRQTQTLLKKTCQQAG